MNTPEPDARDAGLASRLLIALASPLHQAGWGALAFGSIFLWAFAIDCEIWSPLLFRGTLASAPGQIVRVDKTHSRENNRLVYAVGYRFDATARKDLAGVGYTTGNPPQVGQHVTVEYRPDDPTLSRMVGYRHFTWGWGAAFVCIIPLVGLVLVAVSLATGWRRAGLLSAGLPARGTLVSTESTNASVNNRIVMKYTYTFQTADGQSFNAIARTSRADRLSADGVEMVLYDPADPARNLVVTLAPAWQAILRRQTARYLALVFILPTLALAINIAGWVLRHRA